MPPAGVTAVKELGTKRCTPAAFAASASVYWSWASNGLKAETTTSTPARAAARRPWSPSRSTTTVSTPRSLSLTLAGLESDSWRVRAMTVCVVSVKV